MLYDIFKDKKEEKNIKQNWIIFDYKNGHKDINCNNFLEKSYTWCSYKVNKRYYKGFFNKQEINFIFKVLDYHKGKILALNG